MVYSALLKYFLFALFAVSGIAKLLSPESAVEFIRSAFGIDHKILLHVAVYAFSTAEVLCAVLLLLPRYRVFALRSFMVMLILFTAALLYVSFINNGTEECGCFGSIPSGIFTVNSSIIKNLLLLFLISLSLNQRRTDE